MPNDILDLFSDNDEIIELNYPVLTYPEKVKSRNFDKTPTTNIDGDYLIEKLPLGNNYEITPSLNTPLLESVSTFDIVLINRHILGTRFFDSPYKYIAADINQSEGVSAADITELRKV